MKSPYPFLRIIIILGSLLIGTFVGFSLFSIFRPEISHIIFQKEKPGKTDLSFSSFVRTYPALSIMIENELLSRPFQVGLASAEVVYEAPTEASITRFLAIFPQSYDEKIGPVRSARSYFLDWAHEYKGIYAHVGGNFDALARLRKEAGVFNVDQFFYENYFWRENVGKTALEHTMFTSGKKLKQLADDKGWAGTSVNHPLLIRTGNAEDFFNYPEATSISIDFGFSSYRVKYEYDAASKKYLRSQARASHVDHLNNVHIAPTTVIVQSVDAWSNNDPAGTISIKTIGQNDASIFTAGRVIEGVWKKESLLEPTRFFDKENREISLPGAGPVWVEILPKTNSFSYLP